MKENLKFLGIQPTHQNSSFLSSFYHFDGWKNILVDNKLPMHSTAKAAYTKCYRKVLHAETTYTDETDFWVPLLEKAMAKFCGSYSVLNDGGTVANGLHYLTGCPTMEISLSDQVRSRSIKINWWPTYF